MLTPHGSDDFSVPQPPDKSAPAPGEEQRRLTQRMETLGLLTAGIAHDFNNLLTVINGYNEMLLSSTELSGRSREYVSIVSAAGARAATLVRSLLTFSRPTPAAPKILDLNRSIAEMSALVRRLLPANIEVVTLLSAVLHPVLADPAGIDQIVLNLVVNSRDALPDGGTVEIRTSNQEITLPSGPAPAGKYVVLTVTDNGAGMDPDTRQRALTPFYTTKAPGAGTGLGLSIVQQVVEQSGGYLSLESAPGRGTCVRIYLPAAFGEPVREQPLPAAQARGGHEVVLLVEDHPELRHLMRTLLEDQGYTVFAAGTAAEALELSGRLENRLSLLVSDVVLPDLGGGELARRLRARHPGLPVLHISGYDEQAAGDTVSEPRAEWLAKPFTPAALGLRVRSLLDRKRRRRVLFVDDDAELVIFASGILRDAGFEVLIGGNGDVALATAEVEPLDLVITDLVMREREGLETIMRLRKSHPHIPIIAISGAFGGHFLKSAAALGARATLAKPFNGDALLSAVRAVVGD